MNRFYGKLLAGILSVATTPVVWADYDTVFVDLSQGESISHARLGIGETLPGEDGEKLTSMFYLSYFQSQDIIKAQGINLGEQKVEIIALGTGGFGYLDNPHENGGAEFDFELANTQLKDGDYDRTAIGFKTQLFIPVVAGFQANLGFNLRPFFLSSDWDDQAELEVEYQGGVEYAFNWDVALYSHYRKIDIHTGDNTTNVVEDVVFGLRARF